MFTLAENVGLCNLLQPKTTWP